MNFKTHYEVLGVTETATKDEIRKAYRQLVLKYHPDRSGDRNTTEQFVIIADAYQVLADETRRESYDSAIRARREAEARARQPRQKQEPEKPQTKHREVRQDPGDLSAKVTQAAVLFSKGRFDEAERIARLVLQHDSRLAMAHAILGDIFRSRQDFQEALARYAYAIQLEPNNPVFARRYDQVIAQTRGYGRYGEIEAVPKNAPALVVASVLSGFMLLYVAVAREIPLVPGLSPLSSWTAGLLVMMFLNGLIVGAALSMTQTVDRWESVARGSSGRLSPAAALGIVAIVNFWASAALYVFIGVVLKSFTYSMSRLVTVVAVLTVSYAIMAGLSPTIIPVQALLWGGNVIYIGALCGWAVADAFR